MITILKNLFLPQEPKAINVQGTNDLIEDEFKDIISRCQDYTMLSRERLYANYQAIEYVTKNHIPGDIVECGVWKGGSMMVFLEYLSKRAATDRRVYLYDTFEGMSEPEDIDKKTGSSERAATKWEAGQKDSYNTWCYSSLEEVKSNISKTNYPLNYISFIKGKVEETLPNDNHKKIALLRLDTDWYSSTKHELIHLYPRLSPGGVLIIDDYGCWEGARKAVDEYFRENNINILLSRIDQTGRMGVKL